MKIRVNTMIPKSCIRWHSVLVALCLVFQLASCDDRDNPSSPACPVANILACLDWGENDTTYVIGHKSPDTDAVCSAIAYASLMKSLGYRCEPRVAGKINNETKMVLEKAGVEVPPVLDNAAGLRIIMTDHNTSEQAVPGITEAKVLQIIDHHALGNSPTASIPYFKIVPLGSTNTVVYTCYQELGEPINKTMAYLMLSALLSDTNGMTSTTVTNIDREMHNTLLPLSGITDVEKHYEEMTDSLASYTGMTDEEIFLSDYKDYGSEVAGRPMGVAQVNSLDEASQVSLRGRMQAVMPSMMTKKERDILYALMVNKRDNYTDIIFYGEGAKEMAEKAFGKSQQGYIRVEGQMSRKKDFIPAISAVAK